MLRCGIDIILARANMTIQSRACLTFIVEAVDSVNRGTLVISAQNEEVLRIFYFIG